MSVGAQAQGIAPVAREKAPLAIVLMLIFVLLVPIEFNLRIGPLFITTSKACLIVMTFVILPRLGEIRLKIYDWLMIAHVAWSCIALVRIYGLGSGIQSSGFYVLEVLIVYLVARIYLKTPGQFVSVVIILFWMVALNGVLAVPEGITGERYIHDFARSITGFVYDPFKEQRMGIWRSMGLFEHAILLGVFCSSLFSFVWFVSTPQQRWWRVPFVFLGTFFSASSAPLLVFVLQGWFILLERVTRSMKKRVMIFSSIAFGLWFVLQNFTNRGAIGFVSLLVLNSHTAYYRRAQWQYAIDDVQRNWMFGFNPGTFTRPYWMISSIDNYWLLIMMRSGVPALFLLFGTILFIWLALARRQETDETFLNLRKGWGLMMVALLLAGATVTFFGKMQPLLSFYIGLGAALANCLVPQEGTAPSLEKTKSSISYTRFPNPSPTNSPPKALARQENRTYFSREHETSPDNATIKNKERLRR